MAKKDKENDDVEITSKQGNKKNNGSKKIELKEEIRYSIWGIGFMFLALLITLSAFKLAGPAGDFIYKELSAFLGLLFFFEKRETTSCKNSCNIWTRYPTLYTRNNGPRC
jgi:hypothetical protein